MFVTNTTRAQCPTDIAPTGNTWTNEGEQSFTSGGCTVVYAFCDRYVPDPYGGPDIYETYIYEVDDSTGCIGGPHMQLIWQLKCLFNIPLYMGIVTN